MTKALAILNSMRELELKNELSTSGTDAAIVELEEAMKPKTCKGCLFGKITLNSVICGKSGTYKEYDDYCKYHWRKNKG